ncbi:MAG: UDP-N-acetylglucosamine 4,6-dehydratase (inverting) [Bacteroidota bacterium]
MLDLNGKSILLTGGTGSFGKAFVKRVLTNFPKVRRLVIFSRDELKQFEMAQSFSPKEHPSIRYFIGDIRDADRFKKACEGIDIIIHAAALKQVTTAEYNPFECIKTNVLGAQNVVEAAIKNNVEAVVALSTDKAAAPVNLYGATKLCSDKLFVAANNMKGARKTKFSVVRYGNVMGSRGSVIPFFIKKKSEGVLPITHKEMTRFNITLSSAVDLVFFAMENALGGEIYISKIPSYKITDVATAVAPTCEQRIVGIRPGEKLHEEMITPADSHNTIELPNHFVICPTNLDYVGLEKADFIRHYEGKEVPVGFSYNSGDNSEWLTVEQMRKLIKDHVDPNFKVSEIVSEMQLTFKN